MLSPPRIEFVVRGGLHLAYQLAGDGPIDLVYVAGATAASQQWEEPITARGLRRLASFSRLVTHDQQGMGYSDRMDLSSPPMLDDLVDDLEAVIAAAGVRDPVLFGTHNGGAVAAVYASRHPVRQLILCNTWARLAAAEDFPIGFSSDILDYMATRYETEWGSGSISDQYASRRGDTPPGQYELTTTSHNQLPHLFVINRTYDIRGVLPTITAPTLVIHLDGNISIPAAHGVYIAESIPGARLVLVPGTDHLFLRNYATPVIDEHNVRIHRQVVKHGGHEVKSTGDGFLVAFAEPESAVRCALDALEAVTDLGLELRAGVHVGEVVHMGKTDMAGVAVHFAQRLCARAEGGQLLVSADVRAECEGSGITFEDRGKATFKGIPGKWEVFEARL